MEETSVLWLRVAAALYSLGLLHVILLVLGRKQHLFRLALGAFCAAVVLHIVSFTELTMALRSFPANNFHETVSLCALLIAASFLFVYWRYQFAGVSVFLFPAVFLMTLVGATEFPVATWNNRTVRDAWLVLHVLMVLFGYAALLLAAVASVFYLLQERHLKSKRPAALFDRLPPLTTLDDLVSRAMAWGFVFITLGIVTGSIWGFIESGTRWMAQGEVTIAFVTWGLYLLMIFLRMSAGWRGRKAALMALVVLGCSAATWAAHVGLRRLLLQ